jgi:hypothetical protein
MTEPSLPELEAERYRLYAQLNQVGDWKSHQPQCRSNDTSTYADPIRSSRPDPSTRCRHRIGWAFPSPRVAHVVINRRSADESTHGNASRLHREVGCPTLSG